MIELLILRGVRRGFSRNATLAFWRADSGLFRRLVGRVPWKGSSEWQRSPASLDIAQKRNLEDAGARCLRVLKDECGGRSAGLYEGLWLEGRKKMEILWPVEEETATQED